MSLGYLPEEIHRSPQGICYGSVAGDGNIDGEDSLITAVVPHRNNFFARKQPASVDVHPPKTPLEIILNELAFFKSEICHSFALEELEYEMRGAEQVIHNFEEQRDRAMQKEKKLNEELFLLRDNVLHKWRTNVSGEVVCFRCDREPNAEHFKQKGKVSTCSPIPSPESQLRYKKLFERTPSNPSNASVSSDQLCEKEHLQLLEEITAWEAKNKELHLRLIRGLRSKSSGGSGLQPAKIHDPINQSLRNNTATAANSVETDERVQLHLDLCKEIIMCEEAEVELETARLMMERDSKKQARQIERAKEKQKLVIHDLKSALDNLQQYVDRASTTQSIENITKRALRAIRDGRGLLDSLH